MMNSLDAGVLIIILLFLIRGVWVGLVRQLAVIVALILGFVAAGRYYQQLAVLVEPLVPSPRLGFLFAYGLVFLAVYLLTVVLGLGLRKVMSISLLGWFDRLMGGLFGLGKGVILVTVLFMVLAGFLSRESPLLTRSFSSPYLISSSRFFLTFIKDRRLSGQLLPRPPAISALMPVPGGQPVRGEAKKKPD